MRDERASMESLAARVVDGQPIDWRAAESACATDEERGFVRNLRIVTDIAHHSGADDVTVTDVSAAATLVEPPPEASSLPTVVRHPASGPDLPAGSLWGPLQIIQKVGHGAFGQVYRARDTRLDRTVALKILHLSERNEEERALADGRSMAKVRHTNVVTVHGAERIDDRVGIWMDYIDGQTLDELVEHLGPLGLRDAAGIGIELCGALAAVHKAGLVHSDIKAQNVMKEKGGRLVLMDFGAARQSAQEQEGGPVSGTPLYMPPEVFEGKPMTLAGDIYSLGVLLYYLVTRSFPVRAGSVAALRKAHARGEVTLLRDARPDLGAGGFVRVVEKALARDPAERFATMGQLQQALEGSIQGVHSGAEPSATRPEPLPWSLASRAALAAGLTAGLFLIVAGALWLARDRDEGSERHQPPSVSGPATTPGSATAAAPQEIARTTPGAYSISAALYRSSQEGRERLVPGARVRVGDRLHMVVEASAAVNVYVLNHDQIGNLIVLFPRPDCDLKNPLPAGLHRLPGNGLADMVPLDWQVDSAGGREQILIVASQQPLAEFEQAIARLPAGRQYAELGRDAAIRLRGIGGVAPHSEGPAPDAARLFEDIKSLAGTAEIASGTWMRQIDLENPPGR